MSPDKDAAVEKLSRLTGIEPHYRDNWGRTHKTSIRAMKAILHSMGIEDFHAELELRSSLPWSRLIEPVLVVPVDDQPNAIPVHIPLAKGKEGEVVFRIVFEDESGALEERNIRGVTPASSKTIGGRRYIRVDVPNSTGRPLGYHTLKVDCETTEGVLSGSMRLIVTPERCHVPERRTWGINMNLYSLRSDRNWGCGDLKDLEDVAGWVGGRLGGGFLGINPLHAIPNRMPYGISPYSSTSRLYRNFIYLDLEPVLKASEAGRKLMSDPGFKAEIKEARDLRLIDYELVARIKTKALRVAFSAFHEEHLKPGADGAGDFLGYVLREGEDLASFATFMAIEEKIRRDDPDVYRWQDWPAGLRDHRDPEVRRFREENQYDVKFHMYVQWLIDRQFSRASEGCGDMPVGIYNDLAVGSSGDGSDAWSHPEVFAMGVCAGAPPDAFNLKGQNWGFPPFAPEKLRQTGYDLFIKTIRHNLRHAGALRIDHALGLFRLFWIPDGMSPEEGTYVRYPYKDLLRIIALESVRNGAVIIGEDLGTVGEEVKEELHRFGMLSYRLFYFERDWDTGAFLPPEAYPESALTAVTTHDLPTLAGYWAGRDIEVKSDLGLYPAEENRLADLGSRERDRQMMLRALSAASCYGGDPGDVPPSMSPELAASIHRYIARTPSLMVSVSLDDVLSVRDQQNMPGTIDTHPNWRQKLPVETSALFSIAQAGGLSAMFGEEGRSGPA